MREECKSVDPEMNPDHPPPDDSCVEHKAQQERCERECRRMRFPYPFWVNVAYLVLGFAFDLWHPGWIIYLTIPLFYLPESQLKPVRLLGNPVMVTIIYLLLARCVTCGTPAGWCFC